MMAQEEIKKIHIMINNTPEDNILHTKFNFNFLFLLLSYCLTKLGVYLIKGLDSCLFILSIDSEVDLFSIDAFLELGMLCATLLYAYFFFPVEMNDKTTLTQKLYGYLFSASFILGGGFFIMSKYMNSMGLYFLILAALFFTTSIYAMVRISIIDGFPYKKKLFNWFGISIILIVIGISLDVTAGASCWGIKK